MSFQFQCPSGHLLEGEPTDAGQQVNCPTCGVLFIIPEPIAAAPAPPEESPAPEVNVPNTSPSKASGPSFNFDGKSGGSAPDAEPEEVLLHIPCPNGHELETPEDMLGQEVLCPQCDVQFFLNEKNSVEYKEKRARQMALREEKIGNAWLNWAIAAAIIVVLGLITLFIVDAFLDEDTEPPEDSRSAWQSSAHA